MSPSEKAVRNVVMSLSLREVIALEMIDSGQAASAIDADTTRRLQAARCLTDDTPPKITDLGIHARRMARRIETDGAPTLPL